METEHIQYEDMEEPVEFPIRKVIGAEWREREFGFDGLDLVCALECGHKGFGYARRCGTDKNRVAWQLVRQEWLPCRQCVDGIERFDEMVRQQLERITALLGSDG